jgi:hypothetical protein
MEMPRQRRRGRLAQLGEGFLVGEALRAVDDPGGEAERLDLAPRSSVTMAVLTSRSTCGCSEQMPLLSFSGSIGMTRSTR